MLRAVMSREDSGSAHLVGGRQSKMTVGRGREVDVPHLSPLRLKDSGVVLPTGFL